MGSSQTEEVKKDKDVEMEEEKDFFPSSASKINSGGSQTDMNVDNGDDDEDGE